MARAFIAAVLAACPAADDAVLCVSELSTNAVLQRITAAPDRHAGNHAPAIIAAIRADTGTRTPAPGHRHQHPGSASAYASVSRAQDHGDRQGQPGRVQDWLALPLHDQIQGGISEATARLYGGLPETDLAIAHRVLATVTERANAELAHTGPAPAH